ncbi:hypothetical protein E1B28_006912 [Marasmius oreades]|uniref:Uncharacterized protein n=1 Tax=Marasmius oreades TaxID=181124 RepID=A0A9P7UUD8_9AGAR|nr:uncharacterized protein E1B28_006912 [Marasmius oreades]KAG7093226.1 hypothetical protein E1B28_006912 [Marasmius oreades]
MDLRATVDDTLGDPAKILTKEEQKKMRTDCKTLQPPRDINRRVGMKSYITGVYIEQWGLQGKAMH